MQGSQHLVTTHGAVAAQHLTTGQQQVVVGQHGAAQAVGHGAGQAQHVAVVQLVHWAQVCAVHADVEDAAHCAVTFVAANSESATNNAITGRITFFTFFTSLFAFFRLICSS